MKASLAVAAFLAAAFSLSAFSAFAFASAAALASASAFASAAALASAAAFATPPQVSYRVRSPAVCFSFLLDAQRLPWLAKPSKGVCPFDGDTGKNSRWFQSRWFPCHVNT